MRPRRKGFSSPRRSRRLRACRSRCERTPRSRYCPTCRSSAACRRENSGRSPRRGRDRPPRRQVLIREGDRGREFFVLLEGEADVRRTGRKLATRKAGGFFGEITLVSDVPRLATVTATSPLRAFVIRDKEFRHLLERTPAIALKVLAEVAARLHNRVLARRPFKAVRV